jgi:S-adenosylmethionine:tRNA ribosyltransferase-isomerase
MTSVSLEAEVAPRSATEPPEARGLARDEVRLLVAEPVRIRHRRFRDLPDLLAPGDVLVVNVSATLPAAVAGRRANGDEVVVHFSGPVRDVPAVWVVELRRPDRSGPVLDGVRGETVTLDGAASVRLRRPVTYAGDGVRLWDAEVRTPGPFIEWLTGVGQPIRYGYVPDPWPLDAYQTVFAQQPGSAEMPSAGRPFTHELLTRLAVHGVVVAPVVLHTGVSSPGTGEPPLPERFEVPPTTADRITDARRRGARIVGVGTTAVRALESVADPHGRLTPGAGWTDLVLGPGRPARVVNGLVTGWHEDGASHLDLLHAVAGDALVDAAYAAARREDYRWHEFGDSCLLLP